MKPFTSRYLLLAAFSLLLGACQSTPPVAPEVPDARAAAIAQLEQNLASSELATAETNWLRCRPSRPTTRPWSLINVSWPKPICSAARSSCKR